MDGTPDPPEPPLPADRRLSADVGPELYFHEGAEGEGGDSYGGAGGAVVAEALDVGVVHGAEVVHVEQELGALTSGRRADTSPSESPTVASRTAVWLSGANQAAVGHDVEPPQHRLLGDAHRLGQLAGSTRAI